MNTPITEAPYDYVFELVIRRTGHYYMSTLSLSEWRNQHPRMLDKLKARGIDCLPAGFSTVKFSNHAHRYFHAN
jgi:hypothetical protein